MRKRKARIGMSLKRKPNGTAVLLHLCCCKRFASFGVTFSKCCLKGMHAASFIHPTAAEGQCTWCTAHCCKLRRVVICTIHCCNTLTCYPDTEMIGKGMSVMMRMMTGGISRNAREVAVAVAEMLSDRVASCVACSLLWSVCPICVCLLLVLNESSSS